MIIQDSLMIAQEEKSPEPTGYIMGETNDSCTKTQSQCNQWLLRYSCVHSETYDTVAVSYDMSGIAKFLSTRNFYGDSFWVLFLFPKKKCESTVTAIP